LEPYQGRTARSVRDDILYLITQYSYRNSLATYRGRPLIYVYDSYHISADDWARILRPDGAISIRGSALDCFVIGLWLDRGHGIDLVEAGFDGVYSYFASDGFSFGSTTANWRDMVSFCRQHELTCSLSVGPGYNDTKIRPWNKHNSKSRRYVCSNDYFVPFQSQLILLF
jgi:glycoprotein endo-alpha-1,2-mannosidase